MWEGIMKYYLQKRLSLSILILLLFLFVSFSVSSEPYNYRKVWNSWTNCQRDIYLWGFEDSRHVIFKKITIIQELKNSQELPNYKLLEKLNLINEVDLNNIHITSADHGDYNIS